MKFSKPLLASVLLAAAACGDTPVEPATPTDRPAALLLSAAPVAGGIDFSADFTDMNERLIPAFNDAAAGSRVRALVAELSTHTAARNRTEALRVIGLIRAQLTPAAVEPVDAEIIDVSLTNIEQSL